MTKLTPLNPDSLTPPKGFSHAMIAPAGRMLFVAGQIGCDAHGAIHSADLVEQFQQALENVVTVVRAAGGRPESIARLTIYVTDALQYRSRLKGMGVAYRRVMGKHFPAMVLVEVKGLFDPSAKIELEATAVL